MKITGVIFWILGVVAIMFMVLMNFDEEKTVDLAAIDSQQIVAGTALMREMNYESVSPMGFAGKTYDFVMIGVPDRDKGQIVYLGLKDGPYYRATEDIPLGALQKVDEVRLEGTDLVIVCSKSGGMVGLFSYVAVVVFGIIGLLFFKD